MSAARSYYVSFDTKDMPGKIVAVKVTIEKEIISDMEKELPINMSEDPLYHHLKTYCENNK